MQLSPDSKDNAPSEAATNNDATDENIIDVVCLMPICNELQRCPLNPHNSLAVQPSEHKDADHDVAEVEPCSMRTFDFNGEPGLPRGKCNDCVLCVCFYHLLITTANFQGRRSHSAITLLSRGNITHGFYVRARACGSSLGASRTSTF